VGLNESVTTGQGSENPSFLEPPKKKRNHRASVHRESLAASGDLRKSDAKLQKEAERKTYSNLRASVSDTQMSFKARAKAKDEFKKRYKQNKWTYVWSLTSIYSVIMLITYSILYLNVPDEHCYF
jgi:hypothetical protein